MAEYKSPGVYVEEVERGPRPIEGASTSTVGFLGETERGPTKPRLITSYAAFKRTFGGVVDESYLAYAVNGFFANGGGRCYVGRVTGEDEIADAGLGSTGGTTGTAGTELTADPVRIDFDAAGPDDATVTIENELDSTDIRVDETELAITGDDASDFDVSGEWTGDVTILEPGDTEEVTVDFTSSEADTRSATLEIPYEVDEGMWEDGDESPLTVDIHTGADVLTVEAVGPGEWGSHVAVVVEDATLYEQGENELFKLVLRYWSDPDDRAVALANEADVEADDVPAADVEEVYDNLSPNPASSDYYESRVNGGSNLVTLAQEDSGRPASGVTWLDGPSEDDATDKGDYDGDDMAPPDERTGLEAFKLIDEISIVCVPDENEYAGLTDSIVTHCENMGDRFAILQSDVGDNNPGDVDRPVDSTYAAFYYPWITIRDPETNNETLVPPGGHVAGIYSKTDSERGVHKAPANEVLRGVQELQVPISKGEQDVLNPRGVNCIRSFPGRGIRVWGARTTSSDPLWKYVNVRRLFLYIEESIDGGTQWAVFEPNDEALWSRVRQTVSNFLEGAWEDGALMGSTPEEAFYVKCDRSTMTQDDIDNGRLICEIGVAPVKPAEFVVFRIAQWTGGGE